MPLSKAKALADSSNGAMIAPAGSGKTHLITTAISNFGGTKELILTHTHAGVDAIAGRLKKFKVEPKKFEVDTIAGWSLRHAASFPNQSSLSTIKPRMSAEWNEIYSAVVRLLGLQSIKAMIRASYSGIYVDEYQDCSVEQHEMITTLSTILPTRVLGDPLQSIFGFGDNNPINWATHVSSKFIHLTGPIEPRRWESANVRLGAWLQKQRTDLEANGPLQLAGAPITHIAGANYLEWLARLKQLAGYQNESVVVIRAFNQQAQALSKKLGGLYSVIEPIDCVDLYAFAERIDGTHGEERALAVIDFAASCMTSVSSAMKSARGSFEKGKRPTLIQKNKFPTQIEALEQVISNDDLSGVEVALEALSSLPGAKISRRELLSEMQRSIRAVTRGEYPTLSLAAWEVRNQTRIMGRYIPRLAIGTALLVKGLEFDHAVILDADQLKKESLYVAITRGKKSLTIVSRGLTVRPRSD